MKAGSKSLFEGMLINMKTFEFDGEKYKKASKHQKEWGNNLIAELSLNGDEEMKENYDDVYSILVENQFAKSKLTVAQQAHITETALEDYNEFDITLANDNLDLLKQKVFKFLDEVESNETIN